MNKARLDLIEPLVCQYTAKGIAMSHNATFQSTGNS